MYNVLYIKHCTCSTRRQWEDGLLPQLLQKVREKGGGGSESDGGHRGHWVVLDGALSPFQLDTLLTHLDTDRLIKLSNSRGIPVDSNFRFILEVLHTRAHTHTHTLIHTPTQTHTHTHKHKRTRTHTCIHTWHLYINTRVHSTAVVSGLTDSSCLSLSSPTVSLSLHCDLVGPGQPLAPDTVCRDSLCSRASPPAAPPSLPPVPCTSAEWGTR